MDSVRGTPRDRPIQASSQFHLTATVFRKFHTRSPFESAMHSLLSGAVQTASEWLI